MAFIKKKWVDVPDPSNPPAIPAGQDALARFDAANMNRIEEGIAGKAPAGHGLGTYPEPYGDDMIESIQEILRYGSGFYQVDRFPDNPTDNASWKPMLQLALSAISGVQLLMPHLKFDGDKASPSPKMLLRSIFENATSNWVEMIHTGNAVNELSKLGMARFASGSYVGTGTYGKANPISIPVPFKPKLMMIGANSSNSAKVTSAMDIFNEGCFSSEYVSSQDRYIKYNNGVISIYAHSSTNGPSKQYNFNGETYGWYIFG